MEIRLKATITIPYTANSLHYPTAKSVKDMIKIDTDVINDDLIMFVESGLENGEVTIKVEEDI